MEAIKGFFFSDEYCLYRNVAAVIGTLVVGRLVLRGLCAWLNGFRAFFLPLGGPNFKKYGSWAVVTGASEGIGRGYALELARRGLNVVLMSRSEQKLNKVAAEIREKYGRDSRVIPVDFSGGFDIYDPLAKELSSLDIGVLINNVGMTFNVPDVTANVPAERLYNVVQVNCQPVVQMSRILLPKMVAKGGGVIVNISSLADLFAMPQFTVYSATKIFVKYISDGIRKEYGQKGIVVQTVSPGYVATSMSGITRASFMCPSAESYAKSAVATIGIQNNTNGCFSHALQGGSITMFPGSMMDAYVNNECNKLRKNKLGKNKTE